MQVNPHLYPINLAASTLVALLRHQAQCQPKRLGYIFLADGENQTHSITYEELDRQARAIAARLQQLNLAGERAILLYPPGLEYIAVFFGCLYAKVIAVPAYPPRANRSLNRIQKILADCQAAAAIAPSAIASLWQPQLEVSLNWLTENDFSIELASQWQEPDISSSDIAFLQYTSGSTGNPKGVIIDHSNLLHNCAQIQACFQETPDSAGVSWLPPYHDMGLIGSILQPLYVGALMVLMPPVAFLQKPSRWLQAIHRYRATTSGAPNFAYDLVASKVTAAQIASWDLSCWQLAFNGAEAVRSLTLTKFAQTFAPCGFRPEAFFPCYGLAEATLLVTGGTKGKPPQVINLEKLGLSQGKAIAAVNPSDSCALVSCGRPRLEQQVIIADPAAGKAADPDQIGEIWVSGASVARGYWQQPLATQQAFGATLAGEGKFLRTGDLGLIKNGELFIVGRLKDLIAIRGRNYYPQDLELTAEQSHPSLRRGSSAAFAIEVEGAERLAIAAEVERSFSRPSAQTPIEEVIQAMRAAIAQEYGISVYGVALLKYGTLPKTSSGKVQRHQCRANFLAGSLEAIATSILEPTPEIDAGITRAALLAAPLADRAHLLEMAIRDRLAAVLQIAPESIDLQQPLSTLGLDSLNFFELKQHLESSLEMAIAETSFLPGTNIRQLAVQLLEQITNPLSADHAQQLLASLDGLSDDQVDSLLNNLLSEEPRS